MKYSHFAHVTARGIDEYTTLLGFSVDELRHKNILDIGCGYGLFKNECKEKHNIDIIGLDPVFCTPIEKYLENDKSDESKGEFGMTVEQYLRISDNHQNCISGLNEELPFRSNSFDLVLSSNAALSYVADNYRNFEESCEMAKQMFQEIIRVLKPDGRLLLCPTIELSLIHI